MIGVVHLVPCFTALVEPFWLRAHFPWLPVFTQGSSNCGKSFVWYPLYEIFKTYSPPEPAGEPRYPLSSLLGTEVVFMSECEWDKRIVSWNGHSDC